MAKQQTEFNKNLLNGPLFLFPAYLIWGLSPLFWKQLSHVDALQLLLQRTTWSLLFLLIIIVLQKRGNELIEILKKPSLIGILTISTFVLALNWYLFIWAVNHDEVLQTSLAYYINPLLTVLLGMFFLKEKLSRLQRMALVIAGVGVIYYTFFLGQFPWISIVIAVSFALYGLIHKVIPVKPLPGLCIETLILSIPSSIYLFFIHSKGDGAMFNISVTTDLLLVATCLVTGLPLLFFTIGTKYSTLTTVGFMQYIAPCCSFLLAVFYYQEIFSTQKLITFVLIWVALVLYSLDSINKVRKSQAD